MGMETGQKGDYLAEAGVPLSDCPQRSHLYGRCDDPDCGGRDLGDDLGHGLRRDHRYAHGHFVVRCHILHPYAFGSGRCSGHVPF